MLQISSLLLRIHSGLTPHALALSLIDSIPFAAASLGIECIAAYRLALIFLVSLFTR